ncbi:hypothetical protein RB195_018027 [Necator americanus]|uniref:Reverse transcriptase domain-containing protein n=1 Tax=Necator americanus TaxID=51031 RepID=A0ABR1C7U5_NECAM
MTRINKQLLQFEDQPDVQHRLRWTRTRSSDRTFLFNFAIDDIMRMRTVDQCPADIVLAPSRKLQLVVNLVSKLGATYGIRLHSDKRRQMWVSSRPRTGMDGQPIELVDKLCYLGYAEEQRQLRERH